MAKDHFNYDNLFVTYMYKTISMKLVKLVWIIKFIIKCRMLTTNLQLYKVSIVC